MRSTTLLTLSIPCQILGWIFSLYGCSFICECMLHPMLFLFLLQLTCLHVQHHVLPCIADSAHETPSLFHSLSSSDHHVALSPHSPSLQSFFRHLELATLFHPCVFNNLPLAFISFAVFAAFIVFVAFAMLPSATIHDVVHCDDVA